MRQGFRFAVRLPFCLSIFAGLLFMTAKVMAQPVSLWERNQQTPPLADLLQLALEKTTDLYPDSPVSPSAVMEYHEALENLLRDSGSPAIFSAPAALRLENTFLTVRVPLLKGLSGNRLCLIRKGEQARFNPVRTAFDLNEQGLKVCQGKHEPDTEVLRRNGLQVVTSERYQDLFDKLEGGECDCFLRSVEELASEYPLVKNRFDTESGLLFQYYQPRFFYVSRQHPELAVRIELGLMRALDDGSFDQLFNHYASQWLQDYQLKKRRVLPLANPLLTDETRHLQTIKTFWYQP